MGETLKRLGATVVAANTAVMLYQCPTGKQAVANVKAVNHGGTDVAVRVAHIDGALAAVADEDYLAYDEPVTGHRSVDWLGITMQAGDTILVQAAAEAVTFIAHGSEIA